MTEQFNFVIAKLWDDEDALCTYTYGSEIHYGTQEEAEELLTYVRQQGSEYEDFQILKIDISSLRN